MGGPGLFSGTWALPSDPGFGLTSADVSQIQSGLVGVPITVNHNGLQSAIARVDASGTRLTSGAFFEALKQNTGTARPVGKIVHAGSGTDVIFAVDPHFDGLQEIIRMGMFNGLSLTHVEEGGKKLPLEISLTVDPARSNATVLREYKPESISLLNVKPRMSAAEQTQAAAVETPSTTAPDSTPEQTPLEAMMGKLSDTDREIFLGRLAEYEKANGDLKAQAEAEAQKAAAANEIIAQRNADKSIVSDQLKYLRDLLEQTGSGDAAASLADVPSYLEKDSLPHAHMALERVVTACSRALAGAGAARPSKRRAVDAAPQKAAAAAAAPAPAAASAGPAATSDVRNLLRSNFDGF